MSDTLATLKYDYETNKRINYGAWVKAFLADKVIAALEAELAQARAALKPFVANAHLLEGDKDSDIAYVMGSDETERLLGTPVIYVSAVRKAQAVLAQATAQPADGQQQAGG